MNSHEFKNKQEHKHKGKQAFSRTHARYIKCCHLDWVCPV